MSFSDLKYYSRRIEQARICAATASCDASRQAHETLAAAYAERLLAIGKAAVAAE